MHICQAAIDAVVANRQLLMVDAELMKNGGMDIVDRGVVTPVLWLEPPLVAFAKGPGR